MKSLQVSAFEAVVQIDLCPSGRQASGKHSVANDFGFPGGAFCAVSSKDFCSLSGVLYCRLLGLPDCTYWVNKYVFLD